MKCPTVSNFIGCIDLRSANIGIGLFAITTLSLLLYKRLYGILNGADFILAIPICTMLIIRLVWFYGMYTKKLAPMVPQLVLSLIKVILLLCMPFLSLTKYDFNYVATKCGLNSDMAELVVHKWSVYLLLIYMITIIHAYCLIVQYSYYKLVKDATIIKDEDDKLEKVKSGLPSNNA